MDKVLNDKAGLEKGCCIVVYGCSYLAAIPIGFLIGMILRYAKQWEEMGGWAE